MHITFESLGTHGDVAPLIAVAQELQRRGHSCELLTNEVFAPAALAAGLEVSAVSTQHGLLPGVPRFDDYLYRSFSAICERFAQHPSRARLVVNCDRYCASNLVAERHGLRVVRLHLSPFKLRPYDTRRTPPYDLFAKNERVLAYVNELRQRLGLHGVDTAFHEEAYVLRHVATFPRWLGPELPAAAPELDYVGFPLPAERGPLPHALRAFIDRHGKPLVFTYGTANDDVRDFIRQADACCRELERPGVVLCPRGVPSDGGTERFMLCPFVPLGALLPESLLLVHHGGIGTAARALEAGLPQVIIPRWFDQPDNAARLAALGACSVLAPRDFSAHSLAFAVRSLLDHDGHVARRARELGGRVRGMNAIERWADLLETESLHAAA